MSNPDYTVMIVDDDINFARRLAEFLQHRGFEVRCTDRADEARTEILSFKPRFVFYDLVMHEFNAIQMLQFIGLNDDLRRRKIKFMVTSRHNNITNVRECIKAGAADYIIKPFQFEDIFSRLIFHAQQKRRVIAIEKESQGQLEGGELYLHLFGFVMKEATSNKPFNEVMYNLTKMTALALKAVRCSVVETHENRMDGWVRASSDDPGMNTFALDLSRYPEIISVLNTEEVSVVENLNKDPLLAEIKRNFQKISFNSMIVCPVYRRGNLYGVLSTRMATSDAFTDNEIRFAQLMALVVSLVISSQFPMPVEMQDSA